MRWFKKEKFRPELLKEATQLKSERKYDEACDKLREAYKARLDPDFGYIEEATTEDRVRVPMYLQLAGKNDDGWSELCLLLNEHLKAGSQYTIIKQSRIFLTKEKKYDLAVIYAIWAMFAELGAQKELEKRVFSEIDKNPEFHKEDNKDIVAYTEKGTPVKSCYYSGIMRNMERICSLSWVKKELATPLKKAKSSNSLDVMSVEVSKDLTTNNKFDFEKFERILYAGEIN